MPIKRKQAPDTDSEPPTKRWTRSSGPLVETQATRSPGRSARGSGPKGTVQSLSKRISVDTNSTRTRAKIYGRDSSNSSLKENQLESSDESSEDELNLSPSKVRLARMATSSSATDGSRTEVIIPRLHPEDSISLRKRIEAVEPMDPYPKTPTKPKKLVTYTSRDKKKSEQAVSSPSETITARSTSKRQTVVMPATSPSKEVASVSTSQSPSITTPGVSRRKKHASPLVASTAAPMSSPTVSPIKKSGISTPQASPSRLSRAIPPHLHSCLNAQKRAILHALQNPPDADGPDEGEEDEGPPTNVTAMKQLVDLLEGTITRGEGNSCLLLGPRGSGKTRLVERAVAGFPASPIVVRLSGWVQHNDRLAMREIARQLTNQTGTSFLANSDSDDEDEPNPFMNIDATMSLPPPSHLPTLISVLPTLSRPTVVILDGFDLFALHARQSLLYCLLDTVQSCRAGQGNKGLAVIGVSTRIDTINLLEKRVKSRFSGRMIRTASPTKLDDWTGIARKVLLSRIDHSAHGEEWDEMWNDAVDKFLDDQNVVNTLHDTFNLTRDVRMLCRVLTSVVLETTPSSPFPTASELAIAMASQRSRAQFTSLHALSYPAICLLIAAMHSDTAGHEVVTFEMLYECFHNQVRASSAAPVQIEGGGIGMVRCTREVLMSAFEQLIATKIFVGVGPPSSTVAKGFVKYRCVVRRLDVKKAVEKMGKTNLKKWLSKAQ